MKRAIRMYPKSVYPVEFWVFRFENPDSSNPTPWMAGGGTKDETRLKAVKALGYEPESVIVENGR